MRSPATAISFSTARDPTKPPAPGWRCSSGSGGSPGSGRLPEASAGGAKTGLRLAPEAGPWRRSPSREALFRLCLSASLIMCHPPSYEFFVVSGERDQLQWGPGGIHLPCGGEGKRDLNAEV